VYPVGRTPSEGFNAVALTWTIISPGFVIVGFGTSIASMFFAARIVFGELEVMAWTMFWNYGQISGLNRVDCGLKDMELSSHYQTPLPATPPSLDWLGVRFGGSKWFSETPENISKR
jgi:hypothetical protein